MQKKFFYHIPTKIFFGNDVVADHLTDIALQFKRAFIVTGKSSARMSGALDDVTGGLNQLKINYRLYDKITANPSYEDVQTAADAARAFRPDVIIAIGGGSPIDAAKAIAFLIHNEYMRDDLFVDKPLHEIFPVIAVPITAGTGSEVTPYSIITDTTVKNKRNLSHPQLFPICALLDPRYTESLSRNTTINTAVDALSHAIESSLSQKTTRMSTMTAFESMELLSKGLFALLDKGDVSPETRHDLMMGSMLAGLSIAQTGTTTLHAMGYPLTYYRNIDHGRANGLLMPSYLDFCSTRGRKDDIDRILNAMNIKNLSEFRDLLEQLIDCQESFTGDDLKVFTDTALTSKSIEVTDPRPAHEDIYAMYEKSLNTPGL